MNIKMAIFSIIHMDQKKVREINQLLSKLKSLT